MSRCLAAVYDDPYQFQLTFQEKRGQTEAKLEFVRDGNVLDPTTCAGLGPVEVASFALRVAAILLSYPQKRKLLVLDETFKYVANENIEQVKNMLEMLSEDFEMQFVIVTHNVGLQAGKVVRVGKA